MSEHFGEASIFIRPDASKFRAELVAQLAKQTAGLKVTIPVLAGGGVSKASTESRQLAAAHKEAGAAAAQLAAQEAALTRSAAKLAAAEAQAARGAAATGLSLLGARGATLAASGSFLAGAAAITLLAQSVQGAVDDQETLFRVSRILGTELGEGSKKWSQTLADSFGLADDQALKFEGSIAEILHNVGVLPEQNQQLSQSLVQLAADMAAFAHVPVEDTLEAITLGVSGNSRGLRRYGIVVKETEVQQRALQETGKETVKQLTRQELALARVALIQERAANQSGAFAASAGHLAQQTKILTANLDSLQDTVGGALIPALTLFAQDLNAVVKVAEALISLPAKIPFLDSIGDFIGSHKTLQRDLSLAVLFPPLAPSIAAAEGVNQLGRALGFWGDKAKEAHEGSALTIGDLNRMRGDLPLVTSEFEDVGDAFGKAAADFRRGLVLDITQVSNQLDTLNDKLTRVQISGGDIGQQLAAAAAANRKAREELRKADEAVATFSGPGAKGFATARKLQQKALQDAAAANAREVALREQIASKAEDAAAQLRRFIEDAAAKVQADLAAADQAFLDAIGIRRGEVNLAAIAAEGTKSIRDDIAAQKLLQAELRREIEAARRTITNVQLRTQTIQDLRASLIQSQNAQAALEEQQRQDRIDARKRLVEEREASLDLDIEFSQITKNTSAEIRAHEAKIRFIDQQIAHTKRGTVEWKRLRNERAQELAAIKELRKVNDKLNEDFRALSFEFLQTQSGFAANLLSNLLPTGAVAGTVGGGSISTPTTVPPARRGRGDFPAGVATASAASAAGRGASQGQMAALIAIQREMLAVMMGLKAQRDQPEAVNQVSRVAASMEIF